MNILLQFLSTFVDSFKLKNPVVFAVVAVLLLIVNFSIDTVVLWETAEGVFLLPERIQDVLRNVDSVIVVILTMIGAHTPPVEPKVNSKI